ncbi:MAG: lipopolysaccharide transport periplasmic protein LptA [Deltaproteobacteria bacterium]|nr:lipopolysaccharide transport periplasmic protein LptA [Deltaproteobacteria bacterium]
MKRSVFYLVFVLTGLLLLGGFSGAALSADPREKTQKKSPGPMVIKSKILEADDKKRKIIFAGGVEAKRDDFTVLCEKLVVLYEKPSAQEETEKVSARIDRIVATGAVKIIRAEGGVATGEKAVYYQKGEKLVLTGNPVVKQGEDFVEGDVITLFLKEDRSIVESAKDKKVRAVIFPKQEKGKGL